MDLAVCWVLAAALGQLSACGDDDNDSSSVNPGDGDGNNGGDGDASTAPKNIVETAIAAGSFNTLAKALVDTGLDAALAGTGPFTVFAPTDAAFQALGADALNGLSKEALADILKYHVVSGTVESKDLAAGPVKTLSGVSAFVSLQDGAKINGAKVTTADVSASNGVIHVIDSVLLPPNLVEAATYAGNFNTLLSAAAQAELAAVLTDAATRLTVFAPTDAAFAALPAGTVEGLTKEQLAGVLTYHVVPGEVLSTALSAGSVTTVNGADVTVDLSDGVKINDARVITADIVTTNGVIHVLDKVLLPAL